MARWCLGIDLGGTFIKFGLLDEQYRLGETSQVPTSANSGAEIVLGEMADGALDLMSRAGVPKSDVLAVGIGSPGPLSISKGVIFDTSNFSGMANVPIRDKISARLDLPATLENDANAAAYGEFISHPDPSVRNLVMLTLGTGIGGGIIVDGKILHGSHEIGAEIGHMIIVPGGNQCGCGQHGCIETYCSATYLAQYTQDLIENENRESSLKQVLDEKGTIDSRDINDARRSGDELAEEVWDRTTHHLAVGLVNISRLFDPDEIVLGGGLANAGDDLLQPVREHFRNLRWSLAEQMVKIVLSRLGADAGLIGAGGVAWKIFGASNS